MEKRAPALVVLREEQIATSDWLIVAVRSTTKQMHDVVMRPGRRGSNAMCSFTVAPKARKAALAACQSLAYTGPLRNGS